MAGAMTTPKDRLASIQRSLGIEDWSRVAPGSGTAIATECPTTGETLATVKGLARAEHDAAVDRAAKAFVKWRMVPAPVRGQLIRRLGELLREHKDALGEL